MLLLLAALSVTTAAAPQTSRARAAECPRTAVHMAIERGKSPQLRKLNELPPANLYLSVYRRVDGCEVPIVVRYDVGRR